MPSTVFVCTIRQRGQLGALSRYVYPFPIDHFTQLGDSLYIRSGDDVLRIVANSVVDYGKNARSVGFQGLVWWPYLDFGSPAVNKQLLGFDIVGTGVPTVQIGFNQADAAAYTVGFDVPADTVPGMMIPMSVVAPSLSVKLTYAPGQSWQFNAMNLYLQDTRPGT